MRSFSEQKGLSLDRLQTLCLVAEKGGVMAAARGNPNRQSLYSRQLRELEGYFGAPLIDRSRTPHSLTDLGRQVERMARGFFRDM
jgi:DNA-binding transcriptional LysR family regulator